MRIPIGKTIGLEYFATTGRCAFSEMNQKGPLKA